MADRQWNGATMGNGWMHRNLIRLLRFTPLWLVYGFSDIFVVPFCAVFNHSGKVAYRFYRKHLHYSAIRSFGMTFRNHSLFSHVVIDKFAMFAGKQFRVDHIGIDYFKMLEAKEEGFIQLSAHVGNYEIAGYTIKMEKKGIHAVVFSSEKETVMNGRSNLFGKTHVSMIPLQADMSHLFAIDQALSQGDVVSLPADRFMDGSRFLTVDFLGQPAKFPQGPFSLASMRGVDALAVNVMKTGFKKYRIHMALLPYDKDAPRKVQIEQLGKAYAAELENMVRQYPAQWFNFFDFWA